MTASAPAHRRDGWGRTRVWTTACRPAAVLLVVLALLSTACGPGDTPVGQSSRSAQPPVGPSGPGPANGTGPPRPAPSSPTRSGPATYLALGDSVAAGVGAQPPDDAGYVPVLAGLVSDQLGCAPVDVRSEAGCPVRVRNLAAAGATTSTVLRDQLPAAQVILAQQDVRLVTVTVGGNDVFAPVLLGCARQPDGPRCAAAVQAALAQVQRDLAVLLPVLRRAAGPEVEIAVMTYYDPVPSCRLAPLAALSRQVLDGGDGLNDVLRAAARDAGALVVETGGGLLGPGELVGGSDCLHPNTAGHALLAQAFAEAVGLGTARR